MSETPGGPEPAPSRRRTIVVVAVVAAIVAAAVVMGILLIPRSDVARSAGPDPSTGASSPSAPTPTTSPSPSASGSPAPAAPVPLASPATVTPALVARVGALEAVQGEAKGPGQVAGPAIRFSVSVSNSGTAAADLSSAVVTAYYGADRTPASQLDAPGGADLPRSVAAGSTATGTYIFTVPESERGDVRIEFDYAVGVAPVIFRGAAPR